MEMVTEIVKFLKDRYLFNQKIGVILGSGLSVFSEQSLFSIDYRDIPSMPLSTVPGHRGGWTSLRLEIRRL